MAADPVDTQHLFLGTATGWIYDSHDSGKTWKRVAQIANLNDLVVDHILVDPHKPKRLVVGAWLVDHPDQGGLFISEDYGKNWYSQAEMRGQSIRALTRGVSDPDELVAGTLRGVFRSMDNGVHWQQISPPDSTEIHEVQSVAVDPADPNVIYAGTWHLPWKTTDGGVTWQNIKAGIIDDSDVFSIIVDPKDQKIVYASACSGIYKSSDSGDLFHKVNGIPSTARRTRKLAQDPEHLGTVFAGTTEGLYRTLDAGAQWERLTPGDVIVNDVYVDPSDASRVLIATERGGVYRSEDGGSTFEPSNDGFSARQVTAYAADSQRPDTLFVGVVNDKTTGGVFESTDGGVRWQQQSDGLGGRDIFSLVSLPDGTLLAGTEHGIYRLAEGGAWADSSGLQGLPAPEQAVARPVGVPAHSAAAPHPTLVAARRPAPSRHTAAKSGTRHVKTAAPHPRGRKQRVSAKVRRSGQTSKGGHLLLVGDVASRQAPGPRVHRNPSAESGPKPQTAPERSARVNAVVFSLARSGDSLFAGTGAGLLHSGDNGEHWQPVSNLAAPEVRFLALSPAPAGDPAAGNPSEILAGGLDRVELSQDGGSTWAQITLPGELKQVGAVGIDAEKNLWVGGREGVWYSSDSGASWKTLRNLFVTEVDSIFYDAAGKRVLVTSANSPMAFSVQSSDMKVSYSDTGWKLRFVRPVGGHLIGATLFDGVVVQPEMVDSPVNAPGAALK